MLTEHWFTAYIPVASELSSKHIQHFSLLKIMLAPLFEYLFHYKIVYSFQPINVTHCS